MEKLQKDHEIKQLKQRVGSLTIELNNAHFELERLVEVFNKSALSELSWRLELVHNYLLGVKK